MWYCCVLVLSLQETGENRRNQTKWQNFGVPDASRITWRESLPNPLRPWTRLSPLILQTPSRESLPLHASRVKTSPPGPNRAQWRPTSFEWSEGLYKEVPCHNQKGSSHFPPDSNQLESRDLERRARLEKAWRGSKKWKLRDLLGSPLSFKFDHALFYLSLFYSFLDHVWVDLLVSRVLRCNLKLCLDLHVIWIWAYICVSLFE